MMSCIECLTCVVNRVKADMSARGSGLFKFGLISNVELCV